MDPVVAVVNKILAVCTFISHIVLILGLIYFLIFRKDKENKILNFLGKHAIKFAFFFAFLAMASSLFYSNYAGYTPCILCWFQRICMYPLVFILGLAWIKKDHKIFTYVSMLAWIGLLISAYHNYIYFGGHSLFSCEALGTGVSCTQRFVFELTYVTIPLMALTIFVLILAFGKLQKNYLQNAALGESTNNATK